MSAVETEGARIRRLMTLQARDQLRELAMSNTVTNEAFAFQRLRHLLALARDHTAFYAQRIPAAADLEASSNLRALLESLPVLTRRELQDHANEMRVQDDSAAEGTYLMSSSSGSTGRPVTVLKHAPTFVTEYDAVTLLDWEWHRRGTDTTVVMIRALADSEQNDNPIGVPVSYIGHTRPAFTRSLGAMTVEQMVDFVHDKRPDVLYVNGVNARLMAREQLAGGRAPLAIPQVVCVSDRVDAPLRDTVRAAFGSTVVDRYSAEEVGYIALQCPHSEHLHTVLPSIIVEVVDDDGRWCESGLQGRVLVTPLHSTAQPLVRYDIGDIALAGSPAGCAIGWPVIDSIVGRVRDSVVLPDGSTRMVTLFDGELATNPDVRDYQVVRFDNAIVVLVHMTTGLGTHHESAIQADIAHAFGLPLPVVVRHVGDRGWFTAWKRREWDYGIGSYSPTMTDDQVFASVAHGAGA